MPIQTQGEDSQPIVYISSDSRIATVDAIIGEVTIAAKKEETPKYKEQTASYVLQITGFAQVPLSSSQSDMWSRISGFQAVVFKNKVYVMGGISFANSRLYYKKDVWSTKNGASLTKETDDDVR